MSAFKAAMFDRRHTVRDSDKLHLMSASTKKPEVTVQELDLKDAGEKEVSYTKVDDKGRFGGLIFRGDDPIGLHWSNEGSNS